MARVISALCYALLSSTAMADTCQAESCKEGPAGSRVLLQSSARAAQQGQTRKIDLFSKEVEAMITDVMKTGRNLTAVEQQILKLNRGLVGEMETAITKGHADDQEEMDAALKALEGCDVELSETSLASSEKKSHQESLKPDGACRASQEDLAGENKTHWTDLLAHVQSVKTSMVPMPTDVMNLETWFATMKTLFDSAGDTYAGMKSEYVVGVAAHKSKKADCDLEDSTFNSAFCSWQKHAKDGMEDYSSCRVSKSEIFERIKAPILDSAESRKTEYTATKKFVCYVDLLFRLIAAVAQGSDTKVDLEQCKAYVPDTDWLEIQSTEAPEEKVVDLVGPSSADDPVC